MKPLTEFDTKCSTYGVETLGCVEGHGNWAELFLSRAMKGDVATGICSLKHRQDHRDQIMTNSLIF